jgi:adenylylsulfate reductase subunit A
LKTREFHADILILGAGTAGCYAALCAARASGGGKFPRVLLVEKAHIERSGCLAAGINAINAYIGEGREPEEYVRYAEADAQGIVRADLLLSVARRFNAMAAALERLGVVFQKKPEGGYASRGWRNLKINGENIKPLLAAAVCAEKNITVLNKVNAVSYIVEQGAVLGALGFGVEEETRFIFRAPAVICATGGAAGLYRPNAYGLAEHALWYPPFNTGAGYAMGILAGAEMTSLEMRFTALRCKGSIAPTGTLAQGAGARQLNRQGERYERQYGSSTPQRVYGTVLENAAGRGPCRLVAGPLTERDREDLYKAYLNMAPVQTLKWLEEEDKNGACAGAGYIEAEIEGTEPYIVGGHSACGYWVDTRRRTTLPGLFAAGDVAGGCPQKYVSGAMAEGEIAALAALDYLNGTMGFLCAGKAAALENPGVFASLDCMEALMAFPAGGKAGKALFTTDSLEKAMQGCMDEYAGGIGSRYSFNSAGLDRALDRVLELYELSGELRAGDMRELLKIYELRERLVLCRSLLAHMRARKESRWPGYSFYQEYPESSEEGLLYVNSRLEQGEIKIIRRALVAGADYEHSH